MENRMNANIGGSNVKALEDSMQFLLNNNFDSDSEICIVTLMKLLDNILKQPYDNPKVRSIRINNPNFDKKIGSKKGGIEFLLACGFEQNAEKIGLLQKESGKEETYLILPETKQNEDVSASILMTGRRLLQKCAIQDLRMKADEIPKIKQPPKPASFTPTNNTKIQSNSKSSTSGTFDPFNSSRYDGMSAAVGMQCTPDSNYVSTTDRELGKLQSRQQKLEQKLQETFLNRDWCVSALPNNNKTSGIVTPFANDNGPAKNEKDSKLLFDHYKKKNEGNKKEGNGFTTKSMRDLERLKKKKVYSHVQLALHFANGVVLYGKFLPKETLQIVIDEVQNKCFRSDTKIKQLYCTPPKRILDPSKTLDQEDLVPAAKIFVKTEYPIFQSSTSSTSFLNDHLLLQQQSDTAFPTSQAIVSAEKNDNNDPSQPNSKKRNPKENTTTAKDREEEMIRKMMSGGKKGKLKKLFGSKK